MDRAGTALIWKAIQMGGVKIIFLLRLLILARLLTPDDFGLAAIATSAVGFLLAITNFGMIPALVQKEDVNERHYDAGWTVEVTRTLAITVLVIAIAPLVAALFSEPRSVDIIRALAFRPLFAALASIKVASLTRNLKFRPLAFLYLSEAVVNAVVSIALAQRFGVWALVAGALAGSATFLAVSYIIAPHRPKLLFDRDASRPLIRFGRWVFFTSLIVVGSSNMIRVTISRQLGTAELGVYYLAAQLAFMPLEVASEVVGAVAFPLFARLQTNIILATKAFRTMLVSMSAILFPVCALLFVLAPTLVEEILGPRWAGTVPVIRILSLVSMIGVFGEATVPILNGLGQPYKVTVLEIVQSLLIVVFVWELASRFGVVGAALAWVPAILASQLISAIFMQRLLNKPFSGLIAPMLAITLTTCTGALVALAVDGLVPGIAGLILASLVGALVTFGSLWVSDKRFSLGFRLNITLLFPQFSAALGIDNEELGSYPT
jgi:O-antigen/teichoic acid export membrane protein